MQQQNLKSPDELAQKRTELAVKRTIMAADRSLMAWIRTGIAMIGFGFTIYTFLISMKNAIHVKEQGGRSIGLFLIAFGIISLLSGGFQYWKTVKDVGKEYKYSPWSASLIIALIFAVLGIFLFVAIFIKVRII